MTDEMTMVERVARAIDPFAWAMEGEAYERSRQNSMFPARAAIAAMREPTKPMLAATEEVVVGYDDFSVGDGTLYLSYGGTNGRDGFYDYAIAAHHAMIDAALKETA